MSVDNFKEITFILWSATIATVVEHSNTNFTIKDLNPRGNKTEKSTFAV